MPKTKNPAEAGKRTAIPREPYYTRVQPSRLYPLRRTNADKRKDVELALKQWPDLSDREIARICAVSPPTAGAVRDQLSKFYSSTPDQLSTVDSSNRDQPVTVTGSNCHRMTVELQQCCSCQPITLIGSNWRIPPVQNGKEAVR